MDAESTSFFHIADTSFAATTNTPSAARSFVRHTLQAWGHQQVIEDAELVASELVTNAVKATRNTGQCGNDVRDLARVDVALQVIDGVFRISVQDNSHERPACRTVSDHSEGGRGLVLVEALSTRWDAFPVADGKVTWAELTLVNDHLSAPECTT